LLAVVMLGAAQAERTVVGERTRIAVFLDEASKDIVHLRVGQERAGWTLRSVHSRKVDFMRDTRIATLFLKREVDDQLPAKLPVDVAASSTALNQRRGR
jgi:hypothetical protein